MDRQSVGSLLGDLGAGLVRDTPYTNRGCLKPSEQGGDTAVRPSFRIHWFESTVWVPPEQFMSECSTWCENNLPAWCGWIPRAESSGRVEAIHDAGGLVSLLQYRGGGGFVGIRLTGEACDEVGSEGVQELMSLCSNHRHGATRIDLAFDHCPFSVEQVEQAAVAGNLNSRCFKSDQTTSLKNKRGRTVYVQGVMGGRGEKMARCYDERGYVRFELVLRHESAARVADQLRQTPVEAWPALALGVIRSTVDFVDRSSDARAARCDLLPWWSDFVGEASKAVLSPRAVQVGRPAPRRLGVVERACNGSAKAIVAMARVMGWDWVCQRLEAMAEARWTGQDDQLVADLASFLSDRRDGVMVLEHIPI